MMGIGGNVLQLLFMLSHYLLADKYRKMAKNVPTLLEGKPEVLPTTYERVTYWVLLALNTLVPMFFGAIEIQLRLTSTVKKETPPKWLSISFNIGLDCYCIL